MKTSPNNRTNIPNAKDYLAFVQPHEDEGETFFHASLREFGEDADTIASDPEVALRRTYDLAQEIIDALLHSGKNVPQPQLLAPWEGFSGKLTIRLSRSLHYGLHSLAQREGRSLNSVIETLLAEGLGVRQRAYRGSNLRPVGDSKFVGLVGCSQALAESSNVVPFLHVEEPAKHKIG